jgi:N-acetylglucosaminyldiphosphoundecaprenol N-acetyl-beta-D-mannosaminyltransferase
MEQVGEKSVLFGYPISHSGLQGDVRKACGFISSGRKTAVMACANPHSLVVAGYDQAFSRALRDADLLIPDGSGILLAARALRLPIHNRVAGYEFFHGLTRQLADGGGARYFFLGSSEQVLGLMVRRMKKEHPEITVCGTLAPAFKAGFSQAENAAMVAAINTARPDVLWVGMTAPKQEKWIQENRGLLQVPFAAAIGAVFDFYAGTKQRSSVLWRRAGLEWLPRFLREPRRLWERNLRSTPIFLYWVLRERFRISCSR